MARDDCVLYIYIYIVLNYIACVVYIHTRTHKVRARVGYKQRPLCVFNVEN